MTRGFFDRDIGFYVATINGHERKSHVATEFVCVTTEGRGSKELYVATGFFRVTTERCVVFGN